jgi:hypothetical protein
MRPTLTRTVIIFAALVVTGAVADANSVSNVIRATVTVVSACTVTVGASVPTGTGTDCGPQIPLRTSLVTVSPTGRSVVTGLDGNSTHVPEFRNRVRPPRSVVVETLF